MHRTLSIPDIVEFREEINALIDECVTNPIPGSFASGLVMRTIAYHRRIRDLSLEKAESDEETNIETDQSDDYDKYDSPSPSEQFVSQINKGLSTKSTQRIYSSDEKLDTDDFFASDTSDDTYEKMDNHADSLWRSPLSNFSNDFNRSETKASDSVFRTNRHVLGLDFGYTGTSDEEDVTHEPSLNDPSSGILANSVKPTNRWGDYFNETVSDEDDVSSYAYRLGPTAPDRFDTTFSDSSVDPISYGDSIADTDNINDDELEERLRELRMSFGSKNDIDKIPDHSFHPSHSNPLHSSRPTLTPYPACMATWTTSQIESVDPSVDVLIRSQKKVFITADLNPDIEFI